MNTGELLAPDPVIPIAPVALDAIELIADEFPQLIVGAGPVLGGAQIEAAERAGARFLVTPLDHFPTARLDRLEGSGRGCPPCLAASLEQAMIAS
jgi:2-keto-3-deoxy-6-phosphogluconate aldolase